MISKIIATNDPKMIEDSQLLKEKASMQSLEIEPPKLMGKSSSDELYPINDLDNFFCQVYKYWQSKGYKVIIFQGLAETCSVFFTTLFTSFLFLFVNWNGILLECKNEATCSEV